MIKLLRLVITILGILLAISSVCSGGDPISQLSNSGVIVPIDETQACVLYQKVIITLPDSAAMLKLSKPGFTDKDLLNSSTIVRAEYTLRNLGSKPLLIIVGFVCFGLRFLSRS